MRTVRFLAAVAALLVTTGAFAQDKKDPRINCANLSQADCARLAVQAYGALGAPPAGHTLGGYTRTTGPGFKCPNGTARAGQEGVLYTRKVDGGTTSDRYWCGQGEPPKKE